jgi:S1-C subfamily serine protease
LFDGHGNLIGITTLVIVGKDHLNQALNFAIPADSFWQK